MIKQKCKELNLDIISLEYIHSNPLATYTGEDGSWEICLSNEKVHQTLNCESKDFATEQLIEELEKCYGGYNG